MSIEDHLAIQELNYLYAYHIDSFEIDEWVNLFTPDAYFDEREFDNGLHVGHDAIRAYGDKHVREVTHAAHLMTNHIIRNKTASAATGIVFAMVEGILKTGFHGRWQVKYEDEYRKLEGKWKIARRVLRKAFPTEILANPSADGHAA